MKNKTRFLISVMALVLSFSLRAVSQAPVFTYQGKLSDTGTPPTGTYQMEFRLFDSVSGGAQIGAIITNSSVSVSEGVFTVSLNFGATAFPGADRFLQISVRRNAGESFVTLNPRQQVASSPYSIRTMSAAQADDSAQLGGVPANQYLQTNGNGSGLTNLNANSITTGTLANVRLGQIPTANIADNAVTAPKIAVGQVVKGVNGLTDNVTLLGSPSITITPSAGNTLTIASTSGGVGGSGMPGRVPLWSGGTTTLGDSLITQAGNSVGLPNNVQLGAGTNGNVVAFGSPNSETGMTMSGISGRADVRYDGTLKLVNGPGGVPSATSGIAINTSGNVGIGTATPSTRFTLSGGPAWTSFFWTASMNLQNAAALGWEVNASGQRFGIGQTTGGLHFFRTNNAFGTTATPPNYDMVITDAGNITQARDKGGLVKAMIYVAANGSIIRCYNGITNNSTPTCGFNVTFTPFPLVLYDINFGSQVNDRFVSVTPQEGGQAISATFVFIPPNSIRVRTSVAPITSEPNPFMIIVY